MALGRPQSQHKGQGGEGSRSASPPNPVRALVLHPGVGRGRDHATAPGKEIWKNQVLPYFGQRHLLPNGIPFLPPPTFCHHASELRPLSLHTPGSSLEPCSGPCPPGQTETRGWPGGCLPQRPRARVPHTLPPLENRLPLWSPPLACPPPQSSARPKAGALVSATGMDTSAPWQQREGKLPWAPGPSTALSRLHSEKSLSGQKQGQGGRRGRSPRGVVSRLPPSPRCGGGRKGKAGVGVSPLHLSPHHAMPAAKAWLVRQTTQKGVEACTPAELGRGAGIGLGAPRQTPQTRTSQGKERAGL